MPPQPDDLLPVLRKFQLQDVFKKNEGGSKSGTFLTRLSRALLSSRLCWGV